MYTTILNLVAPWLLINNFLSELSFAHRQTKDNYISSEGITNLKLDNV